MSDPMEALIAQALTRSGIGYSRDEGGGNPSGLDFRLENGVEIEVKRFHSPRIAEQMSRAPDVIAVQGEKAVEFVAGLFEMLVEARFFANEVRFGGHFTEKGRARADDLVKRIDALQEAGS